MNTPHASPALLAVRGLSKRYGETVALAGVDIDFANRGIHTILGENGSGKSTLVKILSGVVAADQGEIALAGAGFAGRTPAQFARAGFATVFQEILVAPDRSVIDNVLLGLDGFVRRGIPRSERADRVAAILGEIARTPVPLRALVGELALAQQQLVVIARALLRNARVLIFDESTAALDHADRESVFAAMRRRAADGSSVLFISHRMDEVLSLSDQISVLRGGRLVRTVPRSEASAELLLALTAPPRREATDG